MKKRLSSASAKPLLVFSVMTAFGAAAWAGGEPWKGKPYQRKDIERVILDSPWSRATTVSRTWLPISSRDLPDKIISGSGRPISTELQRSGELLIRSSDVASGHTLPPRRESTPAFLANLPASPSQSSVSLAAAPPESADGLLVEARSLLEKGGVNEAERLARQYLQIHPESADGHFLLGHILFREIQADAAGATQLEGVQILRANPEDGNFIPVKARASLAEFTLGAKYHEPSAADLKVVALDFVLLGSYADADKWLTKMLEWTPGDADGWYLLGRTKYNENRFAEAVSAFQQSLRLAPRNVKTEDNLGLSYAGLGRNEEAIAAYQQAMAWQTQAPQKNPGPHINLASLLIDQNRSGEAVPHLLRAIEIAPRESRAHELLGKAYTRMEQFSKAQTELEKAIELSPQSSNLHCMLAPVYRKQGLAEKAKAEFDRCAQMAGTRSTPEKPRP